MTSPEQPLRILHLSDTHLSAPGVLHHGAVDTLEATRRVLDACAALPSPDVVVVSGDVSDDGSPESYAAARDVVGGWARARGARVVLAAGNHDQRGPFRRVLGDGHLGGPADGGGEGSAGGGRAASGENGGAHAAAPGAPGAPAGGGAAPAEDDPVDATSWVGGRRLVTLDSSVPGAGYGRLDAAQLDRLRDELRAPAPGGTVLVVHHPPLPPVTRLHGVLRLRGLDELAAVLAGSDVRVILSGHYHHAMSGVFAGRPVVVAPGVANRTDTLVRPGAERAVRGSGAALVELGRDGSLHATFHVAPDPDEGREVFFYAADVVERIAAAAGPPGED
ncbi:metallophosphoesterase [Cellulomonas cellasea]|uniref:3',5'-cyclic AMP phosphodiesterase CpdA n=1 Tax=Cellulomonas cellasea TaxID=43670 RepID=A0A7W4UIN8_9CELL|nr:metallophosphoesterase [Cellulomonas cellasea]MBB2924380.1 3',5'-cyclic AMP phosphodiesterase CpdA [Cellulomonas cellasea]